MEEHVIKANRLKKIYKLSAEKITALKEINFEIKQGDILILEEWDPKTKQYTGKKIRKRVKYALRFKLDDFGQEKEIKKKGLYVIQL